jgi:hypothetical protein
LPSTRQSPIAALELGVNLLSAWLLRDEHDNEHHDHGRHNGIAVI